jgi:thiaminase/transcriptional activator TenA
MGQSVSASPSLAARLWSANADLAEAALRHPFVRGLGDGTLTLASFQRYIAQDAYFLDAFARAYALALAYCPDRHGVTELRALLNGAVEELALHQGYAARWGIDVDQVEPLPATLAYTSFLLSTAEERDTGLLCAAMTPCMRLYAHLGQALAAGGPAGGPYAEWVATYADPDFEQLAQTLAERRLDRMDHAYAEWVRTYASPEFDALASRLESLLDRYATADRMAVTGAYRRAMQLELDFFQATL